MTVQCKLYQDGVCSGLLSTGKPCSHSMPHLPSLGCDREDDDTCYITDTKGERRLYKQHCSPAKTRSPKAVMVKQSKQQEVETQSVITTIKL